MKSAFRRMRPQMGTYVEIGTLTSSSDVDLAFIFDQAFGAIENIQNLLSFHDPKSDLSRLNYSFGEFVTLSRPSLQVLRLAKVVSAVSRGLFNPTMGVYLQSLGVLPEHSDHYQTACPSVMAGTCDDIEIQGPKVRLRRPLCVVLDGIAKGYAVDCAIKTLRAQGLSNGWVNAGGDLRVFGDIVLPLQIRTEFGLSESLGGIRNCAVATSVVTKKPSKDFPGRIVSAVGRAPQVGTWTVMASSAWRADALTKVASLCTDQERESIIENLGGRCL